MKLKSMEVENFRCYKSKTKITFDDLTTIIGKNDIGKSTILEALEIFFNNSLVNIAQDDLNIQSDDCNLSITCEFSSLPDKIILDSGAETTLKSEYLLTSDSTLKIKKTYDCSKKKPSEVICIIAEHPTAGGVDNLLTLKEAELRKIIKEKGIESPLKGNPMMRKAIWSDTSNLCIKEVEIDVTKTKEDAKKVWEQIEGYLPLFALFQSDRSSKDSDSEIQNPMKTAISLAISEVQEDINHIQEKVKQRTEEIAKNTHDALKTIDSNLAAELTPEFISPTMSKWVGLFSLNLNTDGIPLNKRGSGVRRLILVSFFKAEAERLLRKGNKKSIIYAIEEPETAQHPNNQKILQSSLSSLSSEPNCQVILTTHSPGFASDLPVEGIRYITRNEDRPIIKSGVDVFGDVALDLGVSPDSRVKVLLCVEGPTDVSALKALSSVLHQHDDSLPNLAQDERVAFVVLGGGNLKHWVNSHYLKGFGRPEVHIYDSDVQSYKTIVEQVNSREDGSRGFITQKHEIESYLHSSAIESAFDIKMVVPDHLDANGNAVPKIFAKLYSEQQKHDGIMGDNNAKLRLANRAFPMMTYDMIIERDPDGEVEGWFRYISDLINNK